MAGAHLIAFGRDAHTRLNLVGEMPAADTALGQAYRSAFANCARAAPNNREDAWCGCYVRTLHRLRVLLPVVEAIAGNPFVDGRTYMGWIAANVPGGEQSTAAPTSTRLPWPGASAWRHGRPPA